MTATAGSVGIFWGVWDTGPLQLVTDAIALRDAEPYGDFLTHPRGHYEVWEGWRSWGASGLTRREFPTLIAWTEYEHFPRGRAVYDTRDRRFTVYADRALQRADIIADIQRSLGIDPAACSIRSDAHYRTSIRSPPESVR